MSAVLQWLPVNLSEFEGGKLYTGQDRLSTENRVSSGCKPDFVEMYNVV